MTALNIFSVLIRKYQSDFEELGGVRFKIQPFVTAGGLRGTWSTPI